MAKMRNQEEVRLIEAAIGIVAGFIHLLVKIANEMKIPSGALYRLATPEGENTLVAAIKAFLAEIGFFRETGEFKIEIPALQRPTLEGLQGQFSWIKSIEQDVSPTDALGIELGTVLRPDEEQINGDEYKRRRAGLDTLGFQHATWLVAHQDEHPEFMTQLGKIYIDFPSLVVVDTGGYRGFPFLSRDGERWVLRWGSLDDGLDQDGRFAVSGK